MKGAYSGEEVLSAALEEHERKKQENHREKARMLKLKRNEPLTHSTVSFRSDFDALYSELS